MMPYDFGIFRIGHQQQFCSSTTRLAAAVSRR